MRAFSPTKSDLSSWDSHCFFGGADTWKPIKFEVSFAAFIEQGRLAHCAFIVVFGIKQSIDIDILILITFMLIRTFVACSYNRWNKETDLDITCTHTFSCRLSSKVVAVLRRSSNIVSDCNRTYPKSVKDTHNLIFLCIAVPAVHNFDQLYVTKSFFGRLVQEIWTDSLKPELPQSSFSKISRMWSREQVRGASV